jgi:hypothetical protein
MYTGYNNTKITRNYQSLFNLTYISYNHTYFDGENVKWEMITPWSENVQLQGSDGFSIPPNLNEEDTPPVYISSIARFANVKYKKTVTKYEMELREMCIHPKAL